MSLIINDISERKAALRKSIRQARRSISEEQRSSGALAVAERLAAMPELASGTVLAYMPMRYELDILPAVEQLKGRGVRIAFPLCIENGGLRLFIPAEENGFTVGAYGIMEPDTRTAEEIFPADLTAVLLPAVGFDASFARLGQGGGYYDRLLARTRCFTVAVGFDCQLVESVPTEPTDMRVDAIVTPGRTLINRPLRKNEGD